MKRRAIPIDEKFVLFDTAEQCADAAAPVFTANRWRWTHAGIPSRVEILNTLRMLQQLAQSDPKLTPHTETGRLVYHHGRFGYERPKETLA